jgi:hypothetical protein
MMRSYGARHRVIDNLSILLSHGLLAWALWLLANRPDLDEEPPPEPDPEPRGFATSRAARTGKGPKLNNKPDA